MTPESLEQYLSGFITERRNKKMNEVLENRTRHLTLVIENIYQPHNASAVVRSCDCFGLQDLHVIEDKNKYKVNPDVALGSSQWVDIFKYSGHQNNTLCCFELLKSKGYRIIATSPHEGNVSLEDLPMEQKTALVLGNELDGLSTIAMEQADGFLKIPMSGFTESLNISVTAAVCMHHLTWNLRKSGIDWKLKEEDRKVLKLKWLRNMLQRSDLLEQEFYNKYIGK
jgi:tRNA (guanosine-2'-O-)-methyltransferase